MNVTATDAPGCLLGDAAGTHGADTAAGTAFAESAVRSLVLDTLLPGVSANLLCSFQQRIGGSFHLLDGSSKCPILQSCFLLILDSRHYTLSEKGHSVSVLFYSLTSRKSIREISINRGKKQHPLWGDFGAFDKERKRPAIFRGKPVMAGRLL